MDLTKDTSIEVERRLSEGTGLGGTHFVSLQQWLLRFRETIEELNLIVAEFSEWIANDWPPWSYYRVLDSVQLISLGNNPIVRPVGVGGDLK